MRMTHRRATPFERVLLDHMGTTRAFNRFKQFGVNYPEMWFARGLHSISVVLIAGAFLFIPDPNL